VATCWRRGQPFWLMGFIQATWMSNGKMWPTPPVVAREVENLRLPHKTPRVTRRRGVGIG